jgi:hypothetical protein
VNRPPAARCRPFRLARDFNPYIGVRLYTPKHLENNLAEREGF